MYCCYLFLISSASVRSIPFLSFYCPIFFAWNVPLVFLTFLKRSLVFPMLLFSSISLHWSLSYLFLLFFGTPHSNGCMFPFLLCFSLLFSAICKASSDNHFAFLHFFFLGMVLIPASCTMSWTSIHSSSGTLSDLIPWIYFSLLLYNHKGFGKHPLPTTQEKSLHMDITSWSILKSDWLYSLQPKMEKLYTVSKNKAGSWIWLRSWTPSCQIQTL